MLLRYGRLAWQSGQGCFSVKPVRVGPRASRRCVRCLRGSLGKWARRESSGVGCLCPRPGSDEAGSCPLGGALARIAPIRPSQLCADGVYQLRFRRLGGTPNYGPRHRSSHSLHPPRMVPVLQIQQCPKC
jgi:hypothetical protein